MVGGLRVVIRLSCILFMIYLSMVSKIALAVDYQKQSVRAEANSIKHDIVFNVAPGLLSHIKVFYTDQQASKVRAILLVDGDLLVVNLVYSAEHKAFSGVFPTPKKGLEYQFQISNYNEEVFLSPVYSADPSCYKQEVQKIVAKANSYPMQASLLAEVVNLDREVELLKYLVYSLDLFAKKGK